MILSCPHHSGMGLCHECDADVQRSMESNRRKSDASRRLTEQVNELIRQGKYEEAQRLLESENTVKKFSKEQSEQKAKHLDEIRDAYGELETAIDHYNSEVRHVHKDLAEKWEAYNAAITRANEFAQEMADLAQEHFGERSEKWQESDAGEEYSEWINLLSDEMDFEKVPEPDELEAPEDVSQAFEELPEEPGT